MRSREDRGAMMALAGAIGLGLVLRLWGLWFGLPYAHARPDETTALGHALRIASGDLNPHFFNWPSLHLYILAGTLKVAQLFSDLGGLPGAKPDFAACAIPGRLYVAVAGTLTIAALYRLTRQVGGAATAATAALFLAVAPLHVRESHFATTDVTMTLLVTASLWLLLEASRRLELSELERPGMGTGGGRVAGLFAAAGLAGGLAAATKYNAAVILAAAAWAQAWNWLHARTNWRLGQSALPLASFVAGLLSGFLAGTPFAVLDFAQFQADVLFEMRHLSAGHGLDLGRGWFRHLTFSLPHGLGIPLFLAALAGFVAAARSPRRPATILAVFIASYYAAIGSGLTVFARYSLPLLPVLCLFAALAIEQGAAYVSSRAGGRIPRAFALAVALVMLPSLVSSTRLVTLLARTDSRVLAARWLSAHLPPDATLHETGREYVALDIRAPRLHYWRFDAQAGHFAGATPDMRPDWLVLHESALREYTPVPPAIERLARREYRLVRRFAATTEDSVAADYDQQDAFFLPLRNFAAVERPGPNISIYLRRGDGSRGSADNSR